MCAWIQFTYRNNITATMHNTGIQINMWINKRNNSVVVTSVLVYHIYAFATRYMKLTAEYNEKKNLVNVILVHICMFWLSAYEFTVCWSWFFTEKNSLRTVKHVIWTRRMLWIVADGGSWWRMLYTVSQKKTRHQTHAHNFPKC